MTVYHLTKPEIISFGSPDKVYLAFDQYNNIVRVFRDELFAVEQIEGFASDIGENYNLWTVTTTNRYRRNLFFDQLEHAIFISIEAICYKDKPTFDLEISIYDSDGSYFTQHQTLAVEKKNEKGGFTLTSWRKVKPIREFIEMQNLLSH